MKNFNDRLFDKLKKEFESGKHGAFEGVDRGKNYFRGSVLSGEEDYTIEFTVNDKDDDFELIVEHEYFVGLGPDVDEKGVNNAISRVKDLLEDNVNQCHFEYELEGSFTSYCSHAKTMKKEKDPTKMATAILDEFEDMTQEQWDATTDTIWSFATRRIE